MFREDEFGSFAPLSGVFPSVFVQAVWVAVDLQEEICNVRSFVGKMMRRRINISVFWKTGEKRGKGTIEEIPKPIHKKVYKF